MMRSAEFTQPTLRTPARLAAAVLAVAALALCAGLPAAADGPLARLSDTTLAFEALPADHGATLRLSGPGAKVFEQTFVAGEPLMISFADLEDGTYTWELRPVAPLRTEGRDRGSVATATARAISGTFTVVAGGRLSVADPESVSEGLSTLLSPELAAYPDGLESLAFEDVLFIDDLIVDGNACVGTACINNESFGNDSLRLKDVNNRIHFWDTSSSSYPTNDWRITANDSVSGGANRFTIEDVTAGRDLVTVRAGAPANSVYVDASGRVGFGTATPTTELHSISGDTPTLRLQQDGSLSFNPYTWDVAGNESGFFIRDVTGGGDLPFRIFGGAPENSIIIRDTGNVGMGLFSPAAKLHVSGDPGNFRVTDTNTTNANRILGVLSNFGAVTFSYENRFSGDTWNLNALNSGFAISLNGSGANEFFVNENGNIEAPQGTVIASSSRFVKKNIVAVSPEDVLARVMALPVATWEYDKKGLQPTHLGPMAEDFYEAFGLGDNPASIALSDTAGVALAAIQGLGHRLTEELSAKDRRIEELEGRLAQRDALLEELLERLEALEATP